MISYYGSKISDNLTKTPEGFLICHNVPIARCGQQLYLGSETPFKELPSNDTVKIVRHPEEVFSKATLASFEGKPVTDDHPLEDVTPQNSRTYLKGICRDVRRGIGEYNDCIVADLMIYDPVLIDEITSKEKREVSCGYDCFWELGNDDTILQKQIRGNHIAIVKNGRAGHRVAVRDSKPELKNKINGGKKMSLKAIKNKMFAMFARDENSTPEEIAEASKLLHDENPEIKPEENIKDEGPSMSDVMARLDSFEKTLQSIVQAEKREPEHREDEISALDELENQLTGTNDESVTEQEEAVTVQPEEINDEESMLNKPACDTLANLKVLKPIVAGIKDKDTRKKAIDSLANLVRGNVQDKQYATVLKASRKAQDSNTVKNEDLGKMWAKKYNPQYKGGK
ncbi:DUF2213 domain-containing protein [Megamonas funiformis]|jgi:hypothetical protein|uniref:DUF2213 domain-containing protein n=1 Tax=Megamonas funiformis TaxID=437897 RepID=UPI00266EA9CF|nr:DUF2213 domain-containing protein [Megamonas funiformis]